MTHSSGQADPAQGVRMTSSYFPVSSSRHNSFFRPHFLSFSLSCFLSLSIHRKAQHHQTQVSMAWPLSHFCEPAKGFTWYLLSRFHLGPVTKQKHRQDEKETVSQRPEWDLEEIDGGLKLTLRCYHTPISFLIKYYSTLFFPQKTPEDVFLEMHWHESLQLTQRVQRRKWAKQSPLDKYIWVRITNE